MIKFGDGLEYKEELGLADKWIVKASIRLDDAAELAMAESTLLEVSSQQIDEYLISLTRSYNLFSLITLSKIPLRCFNF